MPTQFEPLVSHRHQLRSERLLSQGLAGFTKRGPFATKHGWPYYLVDTPSQTVSVRTTRSKRRTDSGKVVNGGVIYMVHEGFANPNRNTRHALDSVEAMCGLIDSLLADG